MISLKIDETEIKSFMNALIRKACFDIFEIRSVIINSFIKFELNCSLEKIIPIQSENELTADIKVNDSVNYANWNDVKPYVLNIIKGKVKPRFMKFIFSLPKEEMDKIYEGAKVMFANISFESDIITITTGASAIEFTLDKTIDNLWDDYFKKFLDNNKINYQAN